MSRTLGACALAVLVTAMVCLGSTRAEEEGGVPASESGPRLVMQTGHAGFVVHVAFSPDGDLLLSNGVDGCSILWQVASGRQLRTFPAVGGAGSIAFSPDGRRILTVSNCVASIGQSVRVFDAATGATHHALDLSEDASILAITFARGVPRVLVVTDLTARGAPLEVRRVDTGHVVGRFVAPVDRSSTESEYVAFGLEAAFSPDGRLVAGGCRDGTLRAWNPANGREVLHLAHHRGFVSSVDFSPDGLRIASGGGKDGFVVVAEVSTGRTLQSLEAHPGRVLDLAFSPDGQSLVSTSLGKGGFHHFVWSVDEGRTRAQFKTEAEVHELAPPIAYAPDGLHFVVGTGSGLCLHDAGTAGPVRAIQGRRTGIRDVVFSEDARRFLTREEQASTNDWAEPGPSPLRLTDATTCDPIAQWEGTSSDADLALSDDGRRVLYRAETGLAEWNTTTGEHRDIWRRPERQHYSQRKGISHHGYRPGGFWMIQDSYDGTYRLLIRDAKSARFTPLGPAGVHLAAFSPDGSHVLTCEGSEEPALRVRSVQTGRIVRTLPHPHDVALPLRKLAFFPDGRRALTVQGYGGGDDAILCVWDVEHGRLLCSAREPDMEVRQATPSPDGQSVLLALGPSLFQSLSAIPPAQVKGIDAATGQTTRVYTDYSIDVVGAVFSPRGNVVTWNQDGSIRFLDAGTGQERCRYTRMDDGAWVVVRPDGRFDASNFDSIEGMSWVTPDAPFTALPLEIFMREYYEPRLLERALAEEVFPPIKDLTALNRAQPHVKVVSVESDPEEAGVVDVTVEVESRSLALERPDGDVVLHSGVHDLRLFRDGQVVAWRDGDLGSEHTEITFEGIQLPSAAKAAEVVFSAYAFNVDDVKSRTARKSFRGQPAAGTRTGTAYIVAFGVDVFSDPTWNLSYAAADARLQATSLTRALSGTGTWARVVPVLLTSTADADHARKEDLRIVLAALAGKDVGADAAKRAPAVAQIEKARPEDLVILAVSTHGLATEDGGFLLLPSDAASRDGAGALRTSCISTDDLTKWLRPVDAGEMAMIVDACQSAASVEQEGFKPGPMGSRGFGQLAWNKKMRILTASQASEYALESRKLRHGLLTHALVREGLEAGEADGGERPDGAITLREWFRYGESRVPGLAQAIATGGIDATGPRGPLRDENRPEAGRVVQRPALFDFSRAGRRETVIRSVAKTDD